MFSSTSQHVSAARHRLGDGVAAPPDCCFTLWTSWAHNVGQFDCCYGISCADIRCSLLLIEQGDYLPVNELCLYLCRASNPGLFHIMFSSLDMVEGHNVYIAHRLREVDDGSHMLHCDIENLG